MSALEAPVIGWAGYADLDAPSLPELAAQTATVKLMPEGGRTSRTRSKLAAAAHVQARATAAAHASPQGDFLNSAFLCYNCTRDSKSSNQALFIMLTESTLLHGRVCVSPICMMLTMQTFSSLSLDLLLVISASVLDTLTPLVPALRMGPDLESCVQDEHLWWTR